MQNNKIKAVSLGCAKNRVDSEIILGHLKKNGFDVVDDIKKSNLIMVNTCGFINDAKEESINTILDLAEKKNKDAKLIVCGCLSERYFDDLAKTLPEVDRFIKISDYVNINEIIEDLYEHDLKLKGAMSFENKLVSTPSYMQYIKISEGCLNRCAFCAIPLIRGNLVSRKIEDIKEEVKKAVENNVYEINIISQDDTRYGFDIYKKNSLVDLLKELVKIDGDFKIRLFYLYPEHITDELLEFIKENEKIYKYFDIPMQHADKEILEKMRRRGDPIFLKNLVNKIRSKMPESVIRTTMIVGFPYETEESFNTLKEFVKEMKFDHLGVFKYSNEEGTKAYTYDKKYHVPESIKTKRYEEIYKIQKEIAEKNKKKLVGKIITAFITDYPEENDFFFKARSEYFGPEEIDGEIYVALKDEHNIGDIIKVKVLDSDAYSITGEEILC